MSHLKERPGEFGIRASRFRGPGKDSGSFLHSVGPSSCCSILALVAGRLQHFHYLLLTVSLGLNPASGIAGSKGMYIFKAFDIYFVVVVL